jgi:hypothetical protein
LTSDETQTPLALCSPAQDLLIRRFAKSHKQSLAFANRRRSQIAGRAENLGGKCGVVGRVAPHIERDGNLAAAGYDFIKGACQRQGVLAVDYALENLLMASFDPGLLKELLSFVAANSAVAMAEPFDFGRHGDSRTRLAVCG